VTDEREAPDLPEVRDRRSKPRGVTPKNIQTWAALGLTALMLGVFFFSNSTGQRPRPAAAQAQRAVGPLPERTLADYQRQLTAETAELAAKRARVQQAEAALNAQQAALLNAPSQSGSTVQGYSAQQPTQVEHRTPEQEQAAAEAAARRKREYDSLYASNITLSYRKQEPIAQTAAPGGADRLQQIGDQLRAYQQALNHAVTVQPAQAAPPVRVETMPAGARAEKPDNKRPIDPALQAGDGATYRLFEGTVLETVLTNRLDGAFNGPVNVMLTTNVYSHDHQNLLVPQGTRVLGEVQKVDAFGQQRLAVFFHRAIMPDGYSISFDQFHGLNQIGETGLRDKVNHHYTQIFGASLAIGAIAGAERAGTNLGYGYSGVDAYREGVSNSLAQSSMRILDKFLNILPTFTVREGHRIKVYLSDDLLLPAYDRHRLQPNL
jgi:type IV secretion system protein VirB10